MRAQEFDTTLQEGWRDTVAGLALGAGVAAAPAAAAADRYEEVMMQPGQTVYSLARAFGTTPQEIQRINKLGPDFKVKADQILLVPKPRARNAPAPQASARPTAARPPAVQPPPVGPRAQAQGQPQAQIKTLTGTMAEAIAKRMAVQAGLRGLELAAFLSQIKHESWDFTSMFERGPKSRFAQLYDKKYAPAKAKDLGNTNVGDGVRYRGRGYVQLTGRDNYRRVGRLLGVDLENNPDLAARPDLAAKIALIYWKKRVRPRVKDWSNVAEVTRPINHALNGLESRKQDFAAYVKFYNLNI